MASARQIKVRRIGRECEPVAIVDGFATDPDALREAAVVQRFGPALHHYPGIRAPLPANYFDELRTAIAEVLERVFGLLADFEVLDASFSIVTRTPAALTVKQRLPHCDAYSPRRIALIHYLSPDPAGTAFFRHRSTGFETIDDARAPDYLARLEDELRDRSAVPPGYATGDTALFEQTACIDARYNRALLYRGNLLHSGAITPATALSPQPAIGRLTVTGFLSV